MLRVSDPESGCLPITVSGTWVMATISCRGEEETREDETGRTLQCDTKYVCALIYVHTRKR